MVLQQRDSYEQDGGSGDLSGRLVVYQILIQIARGDEIAAQKALRDGSGWLDQEQYDIMSTLLKVRKILRDFWNPLPESLWLIRLFPSLGI